MKKLGKILEKLKLKWLKDTTLTLILIAIIVVVFIALNVGIEALDLGDIDLTTEKLYTLTDTSKEQIANLPKEDKIEIYMFDYEETNSVVDLVKQYARVNENITVEVTTTTDRADLASKYNVMEESYSILIISEEKHKLFTYYDLFTYDYNTGNSIDITEQRLTNGIISISSIGKTVPVYMLTGHEEYTTQSQLISFKTYLELENYEVKELDLLVAGEIPEDCETLVIASPKTDFTDLETDLIKKYIDRGGNILWMNDPYSSTAELKNIKSILDIYGVAIHQDGIMIEQDASRIVMQSPDLILPTIESSSLAGDLVEEGTVMLLASGKLSFVSDEEFEDLGVVKTDLLSTSENAFYRKDLSISQLTLTESDEAGKQVVGALLEKSLDEDKTSKLVIYANNRFATDTPITIGEQKISAIYFYNNLDLTLNSIAYIAENEEQIIIRKSIDTTTYTATETQDIIIKIIIFGVPVLIVVIGIIVWQLRRRKK